MSKQNPYRWQPTKRKVYEIIVFSYAYLAKSCVKYIKEIDFSPQYLADIVRDLADSIMPSYSQVKSNNYNL